MIVSLWSSAELPKATDTDSEGDCCRLPGQDVPCNGFRRGFLQISLRSAVRARLARRKTFAAPLDSYGYAGTAQLLGLVLGVQLTVTVKRWRIPSYWSVDRTKTEAKSTIFAGTVAFHPGMPPHTCPPTTSPPSAAEAGSLSPAAAGPLASLFRKLWTAARKKQSGIRAPDLEGPGNGEMPRYQF
jgi:hypothetical protein